MSADLHLHVFEGVTEDDLALFFSSTIGSRWGPSLENVWMLTAMDRLSGPDRQAMLRRVGGTPNIWVGAVSWLKADILDNDAAFIPETVQEVRDVVGEELPVLDLQLCERILAAFDRGNVTQYPLAKKEEVVAFLDHHMGKRLFTVSW